MKNFLLTSPNQAFPSPDQALDDPPGLLCIGGELSPERLLEAYHQGIFPWNDPSEPIMWWSPDPRAVIFLDELHITKRLKRFMQTCAFTITFDKAFEQVIRACAEPRKQQAETWISEHYIEAYCELNRLGHGFSVECWLAETLVGGIYGIRLGNILAGESMFSHRSNASKVALVHLVKQFRSEGGVLIDCQLPNAHLLSLGARLISRNDYLKRLHETLKSPLF